MCLGKWTPFHPLGPLTLVTPSRPIPPNGSIPVLIRFNPLAQIHTSEAIFFRTDRVNDVSLKVVATGIVPTLLYTPALGDDLDLGDVCFGGASEARFAVANQGSFPCEVRAALENLGPRNVNGASVFSVDPLRLSLASGEQAELVFAFRPDHAGQRFAARAEITNGDPAQLRVVSVRGRAWDRGVFLDGGDPLAPRVENAYSPSVAPADLQAMAGGAKGGPRKPEAAPKDGKDKDGGKDKDKDKDRDLVVDRFCLSFRGGPGQELRLELGACGGSDRKVNGELQLDAPPAEAAALGFVLEAKAVAEAGARKPFPVKWNPPAALLASRPGEWVECTVKGSLKGGFPAPPSAEGHRFEILLRALVPEP